MKERKNIFQNKKLLIILPVLLVVVALIGVTYAFFNFTRTGGENSLGTGRIYFNTSETRTVSLTSMFPVDENDLDPSTLASTSVRIVGDTTYSGGEEYLVTLTDVHNTINNKTVPIHYIATYTASSGKTVGDESNDYFNDRGSTSNVYTLSEEGVVTEGERILIGFLKEGETGIDGVLTIKAWISNDDVAISDTYDGTESDNMGTTTEWVGNRVVVTTTEWNGFTGNGALSFKIKTESNEGTWVEETAASGVSGTIDSCPGCRFIWIEDYKEFNFGENGDTFEDLIAGYDSSNYVYSENYEDVITSDRNIFVGLILENETSGKITRAFACGVKHSNPNQGAPFCIEGTQDGSAHNSNVELITGQSLWNDVSLAGECSGGSYGVSCSEGASGLDLKADSGSDGLVSVMNPSTFVGVYFYTGDTCTIDAYGN